MVLEAVFDVLADAVGLGARLAVEKLTEGSEKVDEALRDQRKRDLVEILLRAVWYDGVLSDHERAVVLDELRKIEAQDLAARLEPSASAEDDEALEAQVRALAEGFTAAQRAYALAAVERVLRVDHASEPEPAGPYRRAARPSTEGTLALFRRALLGP